MPPGATSRPANGVEAASILSGDNLLVADYSKNKDLAFQYVKLVTDKDIQLDYYKKFGSLPANAAALETLQSDPAAGPGGRGGAEVGGDPVHRRLGGHPAGADQRGGAVDPRPGQGVGQRRGRSTPGWPTAQKAAQSALDRAK